MKKLTYDEVVEHILNSLGGGSPHWFKTQGEWREYTLSDNESFILAFRLRESEKIDVVVNFIYPQKSPTTIHGIHIYGISIIPDGKSFRILVNTNIRGHQDETEFVSERTIYKASKTVSAKLNEKIQNYARESHK